MKNRTRYDAARIMWMLILGLLPAGDFIPDAGAAESYPNRPLRMIVPYGAGGSYDLIARVVAQKLTEQLGQQVVVDSRPGAAGRIGMGIAVKSAPDGYNLIVLGNTQVIAPTVYLKVPYDLNHDIIPVTTVATITNTLVINPSVPARSVSEFIAWTRSKPGTVLFGSGGTGGITHLAGELFKSMSGADITHVPFKAGVFANTALMSGDIQMVFLNAYGALPLMQAGRVHLLAVTGLQRSRYLPTLPTLDESGLKGYELQEFHGIALPAGTPNAIVKRLHTELAKALSSSELKERLSSQAAEPAVSSPAEFGAMLRAEHEKYSKIVKSVGIKPE